MTPVSGTERARGRPRTFDEDAVVDALMELFWEQGYDGSSLSDIVERAGLNKSSLYNAFGSKDEIFDRALERYLEMRAELLTVMIEGERGLDDLLTFAEIVRAEAKGEGGGRGCLGINTSTERGPVGGHISDFSRRYRAVLRDGLGAPIARAVAAGEIRSDLAEAYVDAALAFMASVAVAARSGAGDGEIDRQVDSFVNLVGSWRLDG